MVRNQKWDSWRRHREQELREKLRAALKEESDASAPILQKNNAMALGVSSEEPDVDELVRLKVARRRANDAAAALADFIAVRRPEKD